MFLDFFISVWHEHLTADAIVWNNEAYSYEWLLNRVGFWSEWLITEGVESGQVVVIQGDFSPNSIALLFALVKRGCIVIPLSRRHPHQAQLIQTAEAEVSIEISGDDAASMARLGRVASHPLYARLRALGHPGLVLFSSGSSGEPKAALHDMVPLLQKFRVRREPLRTVSFLLYDHIGGVNTLLHTVANHGCLITIQDRTPDDVLRVVEQQRVELLPTSPTFLNLVLISEAYKRYDLSSLRTITYGTEPMPEQTLHRLHELLPHVQLKQTYGLSELGILRAKSKDSNSLWVKIGGEGFQTRVVDGILQIKAESAMLGYLNAPSPFTEDGWFNTGDAVELNGEYLKILGRQSEIINVGGEKVYPAEIENVIQELTAIGEVTVYGEPNPITGNIVCARITPAAEFSDDQYKQLITEVKRHCRQRLETYKVPVRVTFTTQLQHTDRYKKARR